VEKRWGFWGVWTDWGEKIGENDCGGGKGWVQERQKEKKKSRGK